MNLFGIMILNTKSTKLASFTVHETYIVTRQRVPIWTKTTNREN